MPRTPILRSLFRLASDYKTAAREDVPLEKLREVQAARVSRRRILQGAGALAATTLLPRRVRAAKAPRVAIVGGGIAGLSTATPKVIWRAYDSGT